MVHACRDARTALANPEGVPLVTLWQYGSNANYPSEASFMVGVRITGGLSADGPSRSSSLERPVDGDYALPVRSIARRTVSALTPKTLAMVA